MKGYKVMIIIAILALVAIVVTLVGVFALFMKVYYLPMRSIQRELLQARVRLLYETDHPALLEACRELLRRVTKGELKPGMYYIWRYPDHEVSSFPQPILDLAPSYVLIDDWGRVVVAMAGGLDHFGVCAYREDFPDQPCAGFELGNKKLIDGLWYYDDGYESRPEKYEKWIQALRPKRK